MARSSRSSAFLDESRPSADAEHDDLVAYYGEQFRRFRAEMHGNLDLAQNLADDATQAHAKASGGSGSGSASKGNSSYAWVGGNLMKLTSCNETRLLCAPGKGVAYGTSLDPGPGGVRAARDCARCRQPGAMSLTGVTLCRAHSQGELRKWAALSPAEAQALCGKSSARGQ